MSADFAGQVAVVTGAARGIGCSIAEHLHAQGARLVLVDCNERALDAAANAMRAEHATAVHTIVADLGDPAACAKVAEQTNALEGHVDILINNAGIELDAPYDAITVDAFDRVLAVNLRAPFLLGQVLTPLFPAAGGAIVNISSIHSERAFPNAIPYACSKAGLKALTRNLALELAPRHIRVNAVCPGYIDTAMWDECLHSADNAGLLASQITALHPLGRRGLPEDVAKAVLFLAGLDSIWITGTILVVDGGLTMRAHP